METLPLLMIRDMLPIRYSSAGMHTVSLVGLPEFMMCKDFSFRESEMLLMVTVPRSLTSHSVLLS
jgi:hypothetical protein